MTRHKIAVLGIAAACATIACIWVVAHQGDRIKSAEFKVKSAEVKLAVVDKTSDLAGQIAKGVPNEYSAEASKTLSSLRDQQNQAVFDVIRAKKKLEWEKLAAGEIVQIVTYTNNVEWAQAMRTLAAKGIPFRSEAAGNMGIAIWVRSQDVPVAGECLALSTNQETKLETK